MASSRRGSCRIRTSPPAGHTWQHVSTPVLVDTSLPATKLSTSPLVYNTTEPLSGSLWSEEWKLFADTNSSDWPSQSVASSTSWSDELESESTRKLSEQFDQLECSLFGDSNELSLTNSSLATECQQWKESFPHLRIIGSNLKLNNTARTSSNEEDLGEIVLVCENSTVGAGEEEHCDDDGEEVFAAHGSIEEVVPAVTSPAVSDSKLVPVDDLPDFKQQVKKAVSDKIFSIIWPDVVKKIEPVFKKLLERNQLTMKTQIPALTISTQADSCSSSDVGFESSSDNFLQVSPKPMPLSVRETSGRKSRMSTISHITANLLDYSNDFHHHNSSRSRNASAVGGRQSAVKLVFPAAAEKLLSPIGPQTDKTRRMSGRMRLPFQQNYHDDEHQTSNRARFCSRPAETRSDAITRKTSPLSNWTRHGVLPPIALKENSMKISSAFAKRSASALQQNEPSDLDARPNTSLPNKLQNMHCLQPLDKLEAKENLAVRMELAHQWLQNQISPNSNNYGKTHVSVNENMNGGWRSKMNGIYWK
ncbi:hypothetical protein LSTR_LSTR009620 [Laodelphax striatellus]|uniref:DUF3719 domain-containing protein n=1 Tax=Laodelphax striatellus TaxID=195883 RepID=A0A482WNG5_LAOST|nr:hypothetical protein LSTR_LSTR009620 [Laodelphax striatellus]